MTELVQQPHEELLDPITGELLDLSGPAEHLAHALDQIRDFERVTREIKAVISDELLRRMDRAASWTMREGRYKVTGQSPKPRLEWNVDTLRATLNDLMSEGVISEEALDAAVSPEVVWKVHQRGINALMKLGDDVAGRVMACATEAEQTRRVQISIEKENRS